MSDPGPEEPALDARHGNDAYSYCIKRMRRQNGDISNNIKIVRVPKMTDNGAEAARDAEHADPKIVFLEWLTAACRRQGCPPGLASFFNIGSLPEEKKVTKTPVKKREYKPKFTPKIEFLKKKENKHKSKLKETKTELQFEKFMERVTKILNRIEKDKSMLQKEEASMRKKNIEINKNDKERIATALREIDQIKSNINKINEKKASEIDSIDRELKEWQKEEERANTEMEKSIEEKKNTLNVIKEEIKQHDQVRKQKVAEEKDRIDREIQNIKDKHAKEDQNTQNTIEAKKNTLAMIKEQCEMNSQRNKKEEAEIDAALKQLKDDNLKEKKKTDSIIAAKHTAYAEMEKDFQKKKRTKQEKITSLDRKIQKRKREYKNKMRVMKLLKAEKQIQIEAEIQTLDKREDQARINLKESNKALQNSVDSYKDLVEKNIAEMQRNKPAMNNEIKEKQYREEIEALRKKLALYKETISFGGTSSVRYTQELPRDLHFSRPSTSSDIEVVDLTDEDTDLPSNSANNTASSSRLP